MENDNKTFLGNFRSGLFSRAVATVTLTFFTWTFCLAGTVTAVKDQMGEKDRQQAKIDAMYEKTPEEKLSYRLSKLQDEVTQTIPSDVNRRAKNENWLDKSLNYIGLGDDLLTSDEINQLKTLQQSIVEAAPTIDSSFAEVEKHLVEKNQPKEIMDRQAEAKAKVKGEYQKLQTALDQLLNAKGRSNQQQAFNQLKDQLQKSQFKKGFTPTDPNHLPFGVQKPNKQEPRLDQQALYDLTHAPVRVAGVITPDVLATALNIAQPTQADLAETIDTTQTQAIKDLATQLNHDPVQIYTWVHNNIRFVPSYGSIQGADMTLQTLKGNAMDTASLLIALLRVSNIPARYAYGTVETTKERVMNWVGGVNVPEAATNLMQQGGIPTTLVKVNGVIKNIRFEQTWVEAWVDFEPSRGMKHVNGDTWVPMDASFKQYTFTQPTVNLQQAVPFDAQGLANTIQQGTMVNEAEGWVQGVPQQQIQDALTNYQTQLQNYFQNQQPNATVGDVLGLQNIKVIPSQPLSAGLPYQLMSKKQLFSEVADSQRLKFKYELYTSNYGAEGTQLLKIEEPTVKLAGKKLALSFKPATQADQDLINSYLPQPVNGQIDPTQLPSTLPGYLIHLVPEFTLDNDVSATSTTTQTMGQELISEMGYYFPQEQQWQTTENLPIAGQYESIALDLQGISAKQAYDLNVNLKNINSKIENNNISVINKHQIVGDLLYATILSYFAINNIQDELIQKQTNMIHYPAPSYGLFQNSIKTQYWFGIPKDISPNGLITDVDRYYVQTIDKDNNLQNRIKYHENIGARISFMEHLIPEKVFTSETDLAHGISAVKAIQLAAQAGQRIYTLTQSNIDIIIDQINFPVDIKNEIKNAILSGKEVITHSSTIDYYQSLVGGYIIFDPQTGVGAYKIIGGENGASTKTESSSSAMNMPTMMASAQAATATATATNGNAPPPPVVSPEIDWLTIIGLLVTMVGVATSGGKLLYLLAAITAVTVVRLDYVEMKSTYGDCAGSSGILMVYLILNIFAAIAFGVGIGVGDLPLAILSLIIGIAIKGGTGLILDWKCNNPLQPPVI